MKGKFLFIIYLVEASPIGEGCLGYEHHFQNRFSPFSSTTLSSTAEYCFSGLADSTLSEVHVSVPAWNPVSTSLKLLWRPDSSGEMPPGGRSRQNTPSSLHSPLTLTSSEGEKLVFNSSARIQDGINGTLYVRVEFSTRGASLIPLFGVPYNIRVEPFLWGILPRIIVRGLTLPLLSSFFVTVMTALAVGALNNKK